MDQITLEVGSGGRLMREFIDRHILSRFSNPLLEGLPDAAHLPGEIAFTTDSYVVDPLFFPGGDIGTLCINGTVNDLVVSGARPRFLSLALIMEEGLDIATLDRVLQSAASAAGEADVLITTGDTKVVRKGQGDKLYINTAGVGAVVAHPTPRDIRPGDAIIVTGPLGEHSVAVMLARGDFGLESEVLSDCAPLNFLLPIWDRGVCWMRDITRGGLATVLCELAEPLPGAILIEEGRIPLSSPVRGAVDLLGIDPLYLACEGRAALAAPRERAEEILAEIRSHPQGGEAAIIGRVDAEAGRPGELLLETVSGGLRLLEPLTAELLPRIC